MSLRKRLFKNAAAHRLMQLFVVCSLLTMLVMGLGLYCKSIPVLHENSVISLLSGSEWSPLAGKFGFRSFILSSIYVTALSLIIAVPIALLTALYLTENAPPFMKRLVFPALDILAGIPSVVYGLWGTLIIVPWIADDLAPHFVDYSSGYTLLAGGIVLSVMILPLLVSLFIEIFSTVSGDLKEASVSLGATRWQTTRLIVVRKASPGIIAAVVLAVSKAFGETLAVLMVCGNMTGIPHSLFESVYPLPALIANNYGEMLSLPMYESALMFAALVMFVIILVFNAASRIVLQNVEKRFKL
ncbi:MAG: phosphate ABC transporter permease subunit PstC [Tannerella sp.]|nr:phosphate ABC transporter permease subunit PstC [Tannerella sp.]